MNIRYLLHGCCAVVLLMNPFNCFIQAQQPPNMPFQISEDDLKKAEAEIEAFRASLSAEERARFDNDVAELTKALENMSENELEQFFTQLATIEQEMPMPAPTPAPVTIAPVAQPEPTKPQPVKKADTRPAEDLLDALIRRLESFVLKLQIIPEIDHKIIVWQKEGKIKAAPETTTWQALQTTIELFKQKLFKLKDKDPKTKEFRYIVDLIDDTKLYEKLSELNGTLNNYEPNIIISAAGTSAISKNSKTFIRNVIDTLTFAFYTDKLGDAIEKIFEKYEPTAKKIKEHEERKDQQALEASRRAKQPEPVRSYGQTPAERPAYQAPDFGGQGSSAGFGGGFSGGGYTPSVPSFPSDAGFASSTPSARSERSGSAASPSESAPTPRAEASGPEKREQTPTDKNKSSGSESTPKSGEEKKEKQENAPQLSFADFENVSTVKKNITKLQESLKTITRLIVDETKDAKKKDLKTIISDGTIDAELVDKLGKLATELTTFKTKLTIVQNVLKDVPDKERKEFTNQLEKMYGEFQQKIKDSGIYNHLEELISKPKAWSNDVQFAYFGNATIKASDETVKAIKKPVNIREIKKSIEEIFTSLNKILK